MLSRTFVSGILLAAGAFAQMSSFPKPSYFRETFQQARTKVELRDPVRLKDFVVSGKLELSLKHYLELVMANNTDIQLQLLTVETPKNNIQAAFGAWDPRGTASFSTTRSTSIPRDATQAKNAGSISKNLSQPLSFQYAQTLDTGMSYFVQLSGSKSSQTNSLSTYNPGLNSQMRFGVTQPLLQNRGRYVNRIPLMQAQATYKVADSTLRSQLLNLVNTAENVYWNVVLARESLHVAEVARDTSLKLKEYAQQQLDLGAISKLDIYGPEQQLAAAEVTVSQARFALASAEDALRHQLGADLDPDVRKLPVELTESVEVGPGDAMALDPEQEVRKALATNPAMKGALQRMEADDLGIQSAKNGLLPNLAFQVQYTTAGQGGTYFPSNNSLLGDGPAAPIPGGLGDALGQMFGFGYPTYFASLNLTLPIRSRSASAAMANALVAKKIDALNVRNQQQGIRLSILNAVTNVEGAKEQLKLAQIQQDFARKNLDAENQKYQLGTDILQNVIQAQRDLVNADTAVIQSQIRLRTDILALLTQTGELLDERGIVIK
ncbi:MAG: TolC family protein [Acidobacteriia bacterium]|nr:TolC family protein [Terriglobia bacterium]